MANDFDTSNDGSLMAAAANMPDFEDAPASDLNSPVAPIQPRDPKTQRFVPKDGEEQPPEAKVKPDGEEDPAEVLEPIDEDEFEIPGDDGKPTRLKASEVVEGWKRAKELEVELEKARQVQPMPEELEQVMLQNVRARQSLLQELQLAERFLRPEQPDLELINEESPRYNPGAYQRQYAQAQQRAQQVQGLRHQIQQYQEQQAAEQQALTAARHQRERSRVVNEIWPEVKDAKAADDVSREALALYGKYGFNQNSFNRYDQAYDYAILKDALAYRKSLATREQAKKVVRATPRLIKAQARSGTPQSRNQAAGMQRLQQSGSLEDAAAALEGFNF